jgi:flavin-dependent dehydrogenase
MLATGKHEARGAARDAKPGRMVGFKTYFRLIPEQRRALAGHVELILFPGGYAGLQEVEDQQANLSLLITVPALRRLGGKWANVLEHLQQHSPHLAERLSAAVDLLAAPLTIARVPYGFRHRPSAADPEQIFRLGDQAAVIQSFTGDGMAIALHSATLAARFCASGQSAHAYHQRLRTDVSGQIHRATILHAALCAPLLGPALFAGAAWFPRLLSAAAALTRVPERARLLR